VHESKSWSRCFAVTVAAVIVAAVACTRAAISSPANSTRRLAGAAHPTSHPRAVDDPLVRHRLVLGYSVKHRPIVAEQIGDPDSPRRVLVVGCIHGNEPAGIAIARALASVAIPAELDLWIVPDLNPDGLSSAIRGNARGVDLNRNFPYRWRPLGPRRGRQYAGPRALSEPETRLAATLLQKLRPSLGIWYHQALDVVDSSQGPRQSEQRYAADTGMPLNGLPDYPGSAVGYEDHLFGPTAFAVELPPGAPSGPMITRQLHAVIDVAQRTTG